MMETIKTLSLNLACWIAQLDLEADDMAKKLTTTGTKKMTVIAEPTGLMLVRLELPTDVHRQFRVEASREGLSMAKMARKLVEEWTAVRTKGGK